MNVPPIVGLVQQASLMGQPPMAQPLQQLQQQTLQQQTLQQQQHQALQQQQQAQVNLITYSFLIGILLVFFHNSCI